MSLASTFAAARSLATVGSVQTRAPTHYSLWPPRNPLIAHTFSVASVLLVDSQNFATPQESSLQPRSMSVVEVGFRPSGAIVEKGCCHWRAHSPFITH